MFIVCHTYINYIGEANMIKYTRAIDREVVATQQIAFLTPFVSFWFFMKCFDVQISPPDT